MKIKSGKIIRSGTFDVAGETLTGIFIECDVSKIEGKINYQVVEVVIPDCVVNYQCKYHKYEHCDDGDWRHVCNAIDKVNYEKDTAPKMV